MITKLKYSNFSLVSISSNADGYVFWKTKGKNVQQDMRDLEIKSNVTNSVNVSNMNNNDHLKNNNVEKSVNLSNYNHNISKMDVKDNSDLKIKKNNFILNSDNQESINQGIENNNMSHIQNNNKTYDLNIPS